MRLSPFARKCRKSGFGNTSGSRWQVAPTSGFQMSVTGLSGLAFARTYIVTLPRRTSTHTSMPHAGYAMPGEMRRELFACAFTHPAPSGEKNRTKSAWCQPVQFSPTP